MKIFLLLLQFSTVTGMDATGLLQSTALVYKYYANSITGNHLNVGSGFFISNNEVITNYHVIDDLGNNIMVRDYRGKFHFAKLIRKSHEIDLALLKIKGSNDGYYLTIRKTFAPLGTQYYSLANYGENSPILTTGIISSYGSYLFRDGNIRRQNLITLNGTVNPGSSGGPIVDSKNRVNNCSYIF